MPTYRYTLKKGHENVVFSEEGVARISENEIESDHELNNPLLTLVKNSEQMTAEKPTASTSTTAPSQPITPPAQPSPAPVPAKPESEKSA